jgi:hypothetical protein
MLDEAEAGQRCVPVALSERLKKRGKARNGRGEAFAENEQGEKKEKRRTCEYKGRDGMAGSSWKKRTCEEKADGLVLARWGRRDKVGLPDLTWATRYLWTRRYLWWLIAIAARARGRRYLGSCSRYPWLAAWNFLAARFFLHAPATGRYSTACTTVH